MSLFHEIDAALSGHGHSCACDDCMEAYHSRAHRGLDRVLLWRLAASAALFIAGLLAASGAPVASAILNLCAILCSGYDVFIRAVSGIFRKKQLDETLLMGVVSLASVLIGHAPEGAAVMLLYRLGELISGLAAARSRYHIEALMEDRSPAVRAALASIRSGQDERSRAEEFITHFARIYTPVVLIIALVIAAVTPLALHITVAEGVYRALVLMVIACPCAVVISVPLGYFAGVGGAAAQGVIFRSSAAMDAAARTSAVVFDKSGALEGGALRVAAVKSERMEADVMLRIAAHACAYSDGVHAEAVKAAYRGVIYIELIQSFTQEPGRGIAVEVDGVPIVLGTLEYARAHGVEPGADVMNEDCAYLSIDGRYAGRILFAAVPKPDASAAVTALSWERGRLVAMVTEDSALAAEKFARSVGVGEFYADLGGGKKADVLREIGSRQAKKARLLYVGDPETDEACLRAADVGVGLNGAVSDSAVEVSDVIVMDDSPSKVVAAIEAAKHTRAIVFQNIAFALGFKIVILILDMLGMCPLWLAVFADVGVTLIAILNALRAFLIKEPTLPE